MKIYMLVVSTTIAAIMIPQARADGVCGDSNSLIFDCQLPGSTVVLCLSSQTGAVTYRASSSGKTDMLISSLDQKDARFLFSSAPNVGGGEAHIRFSNGEYTYILYDRTVRTVDGADSSAGVVVYRKTKKIANLICENDASIRQLAYSKLPRERFKSISPMQ
jgi:hypothetical protein